VCDRQIYTHNELTKNGESASDIGDKQDSRPLQADALCQEESDHKREKHAYHQSDWGQIV
jgi:hypothetical protein